MEPIVKKGPFTKIPITKCGGNLYCAYYFIKKCLFKKMADYKKLLSLITHEILTYFAHLQFCSLLPLPPSPPPHTVSGAGGAMAEILIS